MKRRPQGKTESIDINANQTHREEKSVEYDTLAIGDQVTAYGGDSVWTVSKLHLDGNSVALHIPGTTQALFCVQLNRLAYAKHAPHRPKDSEALKNDLQCYAVGHMATRKKTVKKAEPVDISAKLAESLAQKPKAEHDHAEGAPQIGDQVTVGDGTSVLTMSRVYSDGREVNLEIPGTNLERFRVQVSNLHFVDRRPRKPKEPEKPKIDVDEVREHLDVVRHSLIEHVQGEVAVLKKWLKSKGVVTYAVSGLDEFKEAVVVNWKEAIDAIEAGLKE